LDKSSKAISIITAAVLGLCCCTILILGVVYLAAGRAQNLLPRMIALATQVRGNPTPTPFEIARPPVNEVPEDTLNLLEQTLIPANDYADLACRLEQKCSLPATLTPPASPRQAGEQDHFWITDQDTLDTIRVTATLRYVTPHAYFWVENGASFNQTNLQNLADAFETKIYPTDRAFFGSEWTPGIDDDVHIYVLYTHGMGASSAGYFSSDDEFNPQVRQYSNGHEMFQINTSVSLGDPFTYGTLAHEFQHMIEWRQHRNQSAWMSEGSADLAAFINGYYSGGFDAIFLSNPDLQLNDWPNDPSNPDVDVPHYGASFLFMDYFLDRFGEQATRTLVREPGNGLEGMDQALREIQAVDPSTKQPVRTEDLFLDWAITNYVHDASIADGRYDYHNYKDAPTANTTETVPACPLDPASRTVHQYGSDYISITCPGNHTLLFSGATTNRLLPVDPHSGSYDFWSNKGDTSDMTLTRAFDFTGVASPITLSYWTWYDIEDGWDYVYLEASTDGQHWNVLITPSGTSADPTGSSFGWGYTGTSGGWRQESVDLSQYAGQKVSLRFEYVTDLEVNGDGFLLDDVLIPAIHYSTDFEADDGGWQAQGFARVENVLPQTFRLALIQYTKNQTAVKIIPLAADQTADLPLNIGQDGVTKTVLVVTGTTRFTRNLAEYQISIP
jgi:hypothetical protein